MLLVNASKGNSKIHGIGLIAQQFIREGTPTWSFDPDVDPQYSDEFFQTLRSKWVADQIKDYVFFDKRRRCWVLCGDDARFVNHSDTPNCYHDGEVSYANRDILAGEEITEDYREIGAELPERTFEEMNQKQFVKEKQAKLFTV